jgi:hypothetical protein
LLSEFIEHNENDEMSVIAFALLAAKRGSFPQLTIMKHMDKFETVFKNVRKVYGSNEEVITMAGTLDSFCTTNPLAGSVDPILVIRNAGHF